MDEEKGLTQIYCGPGKGKTSVAIGQAIRAIGHGKRAIVIQFLKGRATSKLDYLSALEPDEILGALEFGIVSDEDILGVIGAKSQETELIMTGNIVTDALKNVADRVVSLEIVK